MQASGGTVVLPSAYHGATEWLSKHVYTIHIQHEIHTTRLYNTPIQHANWKIKQKIKNSFYWIYKKKSHVSV